MKQQNTTVTIETQEWQQVQKQLQRLREQNAFLKTQLTQSKLTQTQLRNRYSMTQSNVTCSQIQLKDDCTPKSNFKNQMKQWSKRLNSKYISKFGLNNFISTLGKIEEEKQEQNQPNSIENIEIQIPQMESRLEMEESGELEKSNTNKGCREEKVNKKKSKEIIKELKEMKLLESICLFGPNQQSLLEEVSNRKMLVKSSLLYSSVQEEKDNFKIYGEYLYPQGLIAAKNMREQEAPTQINQVIFRKNTKKQDCCLFLFRGDDNNEQLKIQNPILQKVNPGRWLSCFFVLFSDFESLNVEDKSEVIEEKLNKSFEATINEGKQQEEQKNGQGSDRARHSKTSTYYIKSKYSLCIFTYFPFINIFEQLLSCILDEIKIKRVEKYAEKNEMKNVSIRFLINQLKTLGNQIHNQVNQIPISYGQQMSICFGSFKIVFDITEARFDELLFSGWAYDIIKIFDKDVLFDLFTNMMTEQSVCFVSENMHLLTYVIFFFVCILPYPFTYPHPCISQVMNYQLLQSPFVVTVGINQSTKWLEDSVLSYPKKIFVDLNDEAKVKGKKKPKTIKSQKLRKIFNNLYKKIEINSPMPQIFKKKATIIRPASKQQNQSVLSFMRSLQHFYNEQIFIHLPNPAIITFIRDKIDETNETSKIFNLLKEIEKYLKQSRKHKERDQFIELLIQQQIFYVHLTHRYRLD